MSLIYRFPLRTSEIHDLPLFSTQYYHAACSHPYLTSTLQAQLSLGHRATHIIEDTPHQHAKLVIEPRWCPNCISIRASTITTNHSLHLPRIHPTHTPEQKGRTYLLAHRIKGLIAGRCSVLNKTLDESSNDVFESFMTHGDVEIKAFTARQLWYWTSFSPGRMDEKEKRAHVWMATQQCLAVEEEAFRAGRKMQWKMEELAMGETNDEVRDEMMRRALLAKP